MCIYRFELVHIVEMEVVRVVAIDNDFSFGLLRRFKLLQKGQHGGRRALQVRQQHGDEAVGRQIAVARIVDAALFGQLLEVEAGGRGRVVW